MASKEDDTPLLDQLKQDEDEEGSDDEVDFDPTKIRLSVPRSLFARRSTKRTLVAVIVCVVLAVLVAAILGVILGVALSSVAPYVISGTVSKSPQDTRQYLPIELNSGLRVLLVSDPTTDVAAAAMDVAVGSFSDTIPGLAHFCEHMLFYASKKYPQEGEYSDFLSRNGGYDNAFTSSLHTNYFFRVNPDALRETLDRFAQFFIDPIFTQDGVNREVNAVNAEYLKNFQSDSWREYLLLKHLSNPQHPFHNFSTGSLQTLNRDDILSFLVSFYKKHYSANQMELVIYGREDTSTLAGYAASMFSAVPDTNASVDVFYSDAFPPPKYTGKMVYYEPVADKHSLSIYWQVSHHNFLEQVVPFISSLIGDEGPGSVIDYLRRQNWATDLSVGTELQTQTFDIIDVDITLTQSGIRHVSDVVGVVMQYASMLRNLDNDTLHKLWNDYVQVAIINFDYAAKTSPSDYASNLASNMRIVEQPQYYLLNPRQFSYSYADIKDVLLGLIPSTTLIFLGSPVFKPSSNATFADSSKTPIQSPHSPLPQTEPIFGTRYDVMNINTMLIEYWTAYNITGLAVPGKNPFIPQDLSLLPLPVPSTDIPVKVNEDLPATSVWWSQSSLFREPKVHLFCDVNSPPANITIQQTVLNMLYTQLVTTILQPSLYHATRVGYTFTITPTMRGLNLHLSGFSDTTIINRLLTDITQVLSNTTRLSETSSFQLSMEALSNMLATYNTTHLPFRYTYQYVQRVVMERPYWKHWQLLQLLQALNSSRNALPVLLQYVGYFYGAGSSVNCFFHGNIAKDMAVKYSQMISQLLSSSSPDPKGQQERRRLPLTPGNHSVTIPTLDPNDQNSVVNVVFQTETQCDMDTGTSKCSNHSLTSSALLGLLSLHIKQSCFDVLRTQQQLGYAVFCLTLTHENVNSFQFIVQSGTYNASTILTRINQFLKDSLSAVEDVSNDDGKFRTLKNSYRNVLTRKDVSLSDSANDLWSEIHTGRQQFDLNTRLAATLDSITGEQLVGFYHQYLLDHATAKKLVIAVYGKGRSSDLGTPIDHVIDYTTLSPVNTQYPWTP